MVNEEVEVDVDEQTEVIRVRKQDDVDSLEIMNDFIAVIYESMIHDSWGLVVGNLGTFGIDSALPMWTASW